LRWQGPAPGAWVIIDERMKSRCPEVFAMEELRQQLEDMSTKLDAVMERL